MIKQIDQDDLHGDFVTNLKASQFHQALRDEHRVPVDAQLVHQAAERFGAKVAPVKEHAWYVDAIDADKGSFQRLVAADLRGGWIHAHTRGLGHAWHLQVAGYRQHPGSVSGDTGFGQHDGIVHLFDKQVGANFVIDLIVQPVVQAGGHRGHKSAQA